jgi:HSP20 family molecular chaperone IbpA
MRTEVQVDERILVYLELKGVEKEGVDIKLEDFFLNFA